MALTELVNALRQQAIKQREREGELLNNIAYLAGLETAEAAADIYAAEKHAYSFDGYLYQLEKLKTVLAAGVPSEIALEAVDSCADADAIIKYYRGGTYCNGRTEKTDCRNAKNARIRRISKCKQFQSSA